MEVGIRNINVITIVFQHHRVIRSPAPPSVTTVPLNLKSFEGNIMHISLDRYSHSTFCRQDFYFEPMPRLPASRTSSGLSIKDPVASIKIQSPPKHRNPKNTHLNSNHNS